jgi:predicted nucleic-acid-binding Zn-ribbon protein
MQDGICPKCGATEIYQRPVRRRQSDSQSPTQRLYSYLCRTCGYLETYMQRDDAASTVTTPAWIRVPLSSRLAAPSPATGDTIRLARQPVAAAPVGASEPPDLALERVCPVCRAETIIPDVRIRDTGQSARQDLSAEVERFPEALLFKEPVARRLYARICANCGYTAFFTERPYDLYEAYCEATQ